MPLTFHSLARGKIAHGFSVTVPFCDPARPSDRHGDSGALKIA